MVSSTVSHFFSFIMLFAHCISFSVRHFTQKDGKHSLKLSCQNVIILCSWGLENGEGLNHWIGNLTLLLLCCLDADAGELRKDIPEINAAAGLSLFQGDILLPRQRSALRDEKCRWKLPIPFILSDSLDLNAKGVILKALEGFRLKSCVNFKTYDGERSFIKFEKLAGCWSIVGATNKGQNLSVGVGCDHKGIVSHEILHALGLFHEQTRTDRDDYVKIWWDHVAPGQEYNFKKYGTDLLTDLNTPYDYESILHYGPFSFSKNESLPTMTTSIPEYNSIIGQRNDFSSIDLERLNRMYNCTTSLTLLDQCDFEPADACGMVQGTEDDTDWIHKKSSPGKQDHTFSGQCEDTGHFMYFDSSSGNRGEAAVLESRILWPRRTHQCLQFFFKMTGSPLDKLIIWIKKDDGTGNVRRLGKLKTFKGDSDPNWKLAHVTLKGSEKFRYLFQGLKGDPDTSYGGIFIDDLTLSETQCPSGVWLIRNFSHLIKTAPQNYSLRSPLFFNPEGYGFGVSLYPRGLSGSSSENYTRIFFHLASGENDGVLEWPALHRQATITVLDQHPDVRKRMSSERSFTTDLTQIVPEKNSISRWGKPSLHGTFDPSCNCSIIGRWGWNEFISHAQLRRKNYLKNDDLFIFAEFEDLTHLQNTEHVFYHPPGRKKRSVFLEEWPSSSGDQCDPNPCQNGGICVNDKGKARCRCAASKIFFYTGVRCQAVYVHGSILGLLAGGASGTVVLAIVIVYMLAKG
ncbi:meprin A subunit alpha-like [Hemicordylus capensis]|uniref:meprin A subunit alpha-like n=1 Tax=Hemicordylus capensis TaxID=884348 RepID=UPI0023021D83|nr:meprin A subunit alpha-like [Hemicordylus capensis]